MDGKTYWVEESPEFDAKIDDVALHYSFGREHNGRFDEYWVAAHVSLGEALFEGVLCPTIDIEDKGKGGLGITQGPVDGSKSVDKASGLRRSDNIKYLTMIGMDVDGGFPIEKMVEILRKTGNAFYLCPSYNHGKTATVVPDKTITAAARDIESQDIYDQIVHWATKKGWHESIIKTIESPRFEGADVVFKHAPLSKYRVFMFAEDKSGWFHLHGDPGGHRPTEQIDRWKKGYTKFWNSMGVPLSAFDQSTNDPARLFYAPKFPSNAEQGSPLRDPKNFGALLFPGNFVDLNKVGELADEKSPFADLPYADQTRRGVGSWVPKDRALIDVAKIREFPITTFLAEHVDPEHLWQRGEGKIELRCPHDEQHSDPDRRDGSPMFAADGEGGWVISCQTDGCKDRFDSDRLKALEAVAEHYGFTGQEMLDWYEGDTTQKVDTGDAPEKDIYTRIEELGEKNSIPANDPRVIAFCSEIAEIDDEFEEYAVTDALFTKVKATKAVLGKRIKSERKRIVKARREKETSQITVYDHDAKDEQTARVVEHILERNIEKPELFMSASNELVVINQTNKGRLMVEPVNDGIRTNYLAKHVSYLKVMKDGDLPMWCPSSFAKGVFSDPQLKKLAYELERVVDVPVFDADGELVTDEGYNPASSIYYHPSVPVHPVSDDPSDEEVAEALRVIDEAQRDFPFSDDFGQEGTGRLPIYTKDLDKDGYKLPNRERGKASRANFNACLMTPFVRAMIAGATPIAHIDKSQPNTGGTKLLTIASTVFDGGPPAMLELKTGDEFGKMMLPLVRAGRAMIAFDNIDTGNKTDNKTLAGTVTAGQFEGRVLGHSETLTVPLRSVIWTVANNFHSTDEITRRMVPIRIDAESAEPALRTDFKHENFEEFLKKNRTDLIWAYHTLIARWVAEGKKPWTGNASTMASFESWANVVGGIMDCVWPEKGAFLSNLDSFRNKNRDDANHGAELVELILNYAIAHQRDEIEFRDVKLACFDDSECRVAGLDFTVGTTNFARDFKTYLRRLEGQSFSVNRVQTVRVSSDSLKTETKSTPVLAKLHIGAGGKYAVHAWVEDEVVQLTRV